ncbi:hypothetical protein GGI22_003767 [Coemansia erecta]|nr:hypothetical protein GGI22_003767 [Coemansia erecta]
MRRSGFIVSAASLLAAQVYALPIDNTSDVLKLDSNSGCLPLALDGISAENRGVIGSVAQTLNNSVFRDFHQFGPIALALGKPDIQEMITGNDYSTTIEGLRELKSQIDSDIPSIAKSAASNSKSGCAAPTVQNLEVVYTNLEKLLRQFN